MSGFYSQEAAPQTLRQRGRAADAANAFIQTHRNVRTANVRSSPCYKRRCIYNNLGKGNRVLTNTKHLKGFAIGATDGEIGTVTQVYFDDQTWAIRYLVVDTGGWLGGRIVLISPISVFNTDHEAKRLDVALTREQVEKSPDIDTHRPVSRQYEAAYFGYYGYPYYWEGPNLWGPSFDPERTVIQTTASAETAAERVRRASLDSHLRSTEALTGYHIGAAGGEIGHLDGFVFDDRAWAIRYVEVATRNWWPGKKVLVSPEWIEKVSWSDTKVYVGLNREEIQSAPKYDESIPISRDYEDRLFAHYGRPPYWISEADHRTASSGR